MKETTGVGVIVLMLFGGWWLTGGALNSQTEAAKQIQEPSSPSDSQATGAYAGWTPEEIQAHQSTLRKLGKEAVRSFIAPRTNPAPRAPSNPGSRR